MPLLATLVLSACGGGQPDAGQPLARAADHATTPPATAPRGPGETPLRPQADAAPVITQQPSNYDNARVGRSVIFRVTASGTALTYQWYRRPNSTAVWQLIPGATASSYRTDALTMADHDARFQVAVKSGSAVTKSRGARLTVIPAIRQLAGGLYFSIALNSEGEVLAWGSNSSGQLGVPNWNLTTSASPVKVTTDMDGIVRLSRIRADQDKPRSIAASAWHGLAIDADGRVWAWGSNGAAGPGALGNEEGADSGRRAYALPALHADGRHFTEATQVAAGHYFSVALTQDGTVWTWGNNAYYKLGRGTYPVDPRPGQVQMPGGGLLRDVKAIASGHNHTLALTADGHVYAWGLNNKSQLGYATASGQSAYAQRVQTTSGDLSGITHIEAGYEHSMAWTKSGAVYVWGTRYDGTLGDLTTTGNQTLATPMTWADGSPVTAINGAALGKYTSFVLRDATPTLGVVYGTGNSTYNKMGYPLVPRRTALAPIQTSSVDSTPFADVVRVATHEDHILVLRSDGSVWGWGYAALGQLGDPVAGSRAAPARISGL